MKQSIGACALALATMLAAGCGSSTGAARPMNDDPRGQSRMRDIELEPKLRGTMEARPDIAAPADVVALTYPAGHRDVRGVGFSLAAWTAEGWTITHYLTSDANGNKPAWWSVEDSEGRGWADVGVAGPGPDHVVIPSTAAEGAHLLCTANAIKKKCTLIRVRS